MVDSVLLNERIEQSGLKVSYIADTLGISRNGFDKKRKNKTPFRKSEIYVICDLLKITDSEDKMRIFFANEVSV